MSIEESSGASNGNETSAQVPAQPASSQLGDEERLAALLERAHPPVRLRSAVRDDLGRQLRLRVARYGESKQAGFWVYLWTLLRENETGAVWAVMAAGVSRLLHVSGRSPDQDAAADEKVDHPNDHSDDHTTHPTDV